MADSLTYCSFADDTCCRGIVILEGSLNPALASMRAGSLGVNPGGELLAIAFDRSDPDVAPAMFAVMSQNTNRLIPPDEARSLFDAVSLKEWEATDA